MPERTAGIEAKTAAAIRRIRWLKARRPGGRPCARIIDAVSSCFQVTPRDILGGGRTANLVTPRHVAIALAHAFGAGSLPEIGRRFGGRDHTTVLHAVRKYQPLVERVLDRLTLEESQPETAP